MSYSTALAKKSPTSTIAIQCSLEVEPSVLSDFSYYLIIAFELAHPDLLESTAILPAFSPLRISLSPSPIKSILKNWCSEQTEILNILDKHFSKPSIFRPRISSSPSKSLPQRAFL
ncbi:hypothetical protein GWI33_020136 [Rhynchophorus ferrugineus]|uniref:Uncharacterized protein n=1 Tax=Rhynchophorus ferrugineus TaxID=354439 RepID=A0A834M3Q7_RHYFE|nr:hypothetical protein GWI33_020136 [Rhynchophorus ferrugineus]